ncbi:type II toxin-antitoxin system PemK/MazF family toxin [Pseudonocardia nigra]|uniref:type II toxin-antitoxin system PemK/MazF family toxin n=1 Tax=Pseudonocardia nigra TaxID=1921578 RepID=UPI0027E24A61|nr:type II toxin-antitoxin system PemK/MazF family toxin [Pseudonocardia nigra]
MANWGRALRQAARIGLDLLATGTQRRLAPQRTPARSIPAQDRVCTIVYAPDLDGAADPGEIVWAWVPFEENDGRGKDRPLLVVGRRGPDLVGLMLSSRADRADDRDWLEIGSGAWDRQGRASYVRLDRVLEVDEHGVRREGAVLDRDRFERVARELRARFGWR